MGILEGTTCGWGGITVEVSSGCFGTIGMGSREEEDYREDLLEMIMQTMLNVLKQLGIIR